MHWRSGGPVEGEIQANASHTKVQTQSRMRTLREHPRISKGGECDDVSKRVDQGKGMECQRSGTQSIDVQYQLHCVPSILVMPVMLSLYPYPYRRRHRVPRSSSYVLPLELDTWGTCSVGSAFAASLGDKEPAGAPNELKEPRC
ncbi:hypothetical protein L210DRAFT_947152 [Boletus edulis BED1]|uniref:Uncharacterized protein n=1 Tax=Boletus edulis BED1 TaxID=1328754 RepID=A0AAD4GGQ5_BOLED|nr:hypothetical protein L210DRAFT_947152 [Boletus edulis BED1]